MNGRRTPVVAVFGSTTRGTIEPAARVGRAVAEDGCVLLTGGGRQPEEQSVKEQAMQGCRDAGKAGVRAARVGVLGVESTEVDIDVDGWQVIVEPDLGHDRNYVNAAMCDVAIAFPGGEGTDSEVVFALALGRPVVLMGSAWDERFPPGETVEARRALIRSARKRVKGKKDRAIDDLVRAAYDALPEAAKLRVKRLPLKHDAGGVVALAKDLVDLDHLPGDIPPWPTARTSNR